MEASPLLGKCGDQRGVRTPPLTFVRIAAMVMIGGLTFAFLCGCVAEPEKPRTVSEWIGQRRVGEELR
jgi:hypothetical protein